MPTYDQLDDEAAWRAEFSPPALQFLAARLRRRWPSAGIWIRGDNNHLRGYHRSRRWIKESRYCTDRNYSVSRTAGDRSGGDANWACALDLGGIAQSELHAACRRLDEAVRAGRLEKITEWYGNFGDDQRVDGWDNISNRLASSDSSHLFHLHMSFDRGRANEDHTDVYEILTGDDMSEFSQPDPWGISPDGHNRTPAQQLRDAYAAVFFGERPRGSDGKPVGPQPWIVREIDEIGGKLAELTVPAPSPVDIQALAAALEPMLEAAAERAVRRVLGGLDEAGDAR